MVQPPVPAMLKGLVFDRTTHRMHHTFMHAKGSLYRYYIAGAERRRYGEGADAFMRFRADDLEASVLQVVDRLVGIERRPNERSPQEKTELVRRHVERIEIGDNDMRLVLRTGAIVVAEAGGRLGRRRRQSGTAESSPRRAPS